MASVTATQQLGLWEGFPSDSPIEDPIYLADQLITYIGNKRALLPLIDQALAIVKKRLNKDKLRVFDAFAGSGVVSRYFKQHAEYLVSNDLELYAYVIGLCYLSNPSDLNFGTLREAHRYVTENVEREAETPGIIRRLYSPQDDREIKRTDRVFYTNRNAALLDAYRRLIGHLPEGQQPYLLAPLLAEASVHANTSGVFKGFYKNSKTRVGQFGGNGKNALTRILGEITLPLPVFSRFDTEWEMYHSDANDVADKLADLDVAYFDPPYNQHPYGSNYFMLNLLVENEYPHQLSKVSGIPNDWNRSVYNKRKSVARALDDMFHKTDARFILLSYNDEGFVSREEIERLMSKHGNVWMFEREYNTFRGCRNLRNRNIHLSEQLFLVERS